MGGLGMFDVEMARPKLPTSASEGASASTIVVKIGGLLELERDADGNFRNTPPAVVRFVLVHTGGATTPPPRHRGYAIVTDFDAGRWETEDQQVPAAFGEGEIRGIAVAVLEQRDGNAFETITWCDNTKLAAPGAPRVASVRP
jgi:hypothetical protein